ncbi:MAG: 50S ribosomal protein L35 [Bacteriovoracia bacterium]
MPKMKTKSAAAKRFKFTATGKVKYKRAGMRHNLGKWGTKTKLKLRHSSTLDAGARKNMERCLPYGA